MKFFTKEWFNDSCSHKAIAKDEQYENYYIDNDCLNCHDAKILSDDVMQLSGDTLELRLDNDNSFCSYDKIVFSNYTIKENAHIKDSWCIAEELFKLPNGNYEFHLMVEYFEKHHKRAFQGFLTQLRRKRNALNLVEFRPCHPKRGTLEYFTVRCSKIEFSGENFHFEYENKKYWKPE